MCDLKGCAIKTYMTGIEVKSWEAREWERSARLTIVVEKWAAGAEKGCKKR